MDWGSALDHIMSRYILNSLTLKQMGLRLLPEEKLEVAVELEGGLTDELENRHATLLLTNKRLIRYSASGHKTNVVSTALSDIDSFEVSRTERNRQWLLVGAVFIAGGLLLALVSLLVLASPISPLLMAFALGLIGAVFVLTYVGGRTGEVVIRAGVKDIRCKMRLNAIDDMSLFVERAYELKMGLYVGPDEELSSEKSDSPLEMETEDAAELQPASATQSYESER